ncbi:MAG: co-chaperone DjlA [Legionellales bacterium]|nr:co-chaperone DjlA [Legionellales bacterium]
MGFGKLIFSLLGLIYLGPIGFILGLIVGHRIDNQDINIFSFDGNSHTTEKLEKTKKTFFDVTFEVMGHLAKSDGRVSEKEILAARRIMDQMQLNNHQIKHAIANFTKGKSKEFSLHDALNRLVKDCHNNRGLLHTFVEIQYQVAGVDSSLSKSKKEILQTICNRLGFSPNFSFEHGNSYSQQRHYSTKYTNRNKLTDAYKTLGISADSTSVEIKKRYRKLMNEHHPDKLIAKGLPEEMIKLATDKTQRIKSAYEIIKEDKNF